MSISHTCASSVIATTPKRELLLRFDRFLQYHPELAGLYVTELVEHWSQGRTVTVLASSKLGEPAASCRKRCTGSIPGCRSCPSAME